MKVLTQFGPDAQSSTDQRRVDIFVVQTTGHQHPQFKFFIELIGRRDIEPKGHIINIKA